MSNFEKAFREIPDLDTMKRIALMAQDGHCTRYDLIESMDICGRQIKALDAKIERLDGVLAAMEVTTDDKTAARMMDLVDDFGTQDQVVERKNALINEKTEWEDIQSKFEEMLSGEALFNKNLCFSNIRELLKHNPNVKIGQIEKEAGVRLGYMSRLEKEGNTAEPSIKFIITAAKLLNVSLDTLVTINISGLTPHEEYITKFFEKLMTDTVADKLNWEVEKPSFLNNLDVDDNGNVCHPLFSFETFFEKGEKDCPEQVSTVVFKSKSFDSETYIKDDCFCLRLKNATYLYLMSIEKRISKRGDSEASAIEAWLYTLETGVRKPLLTTHDSSPIAQSVTTLYETVRRQMSRPQISKDALYSIDSYMKDDLTDDEDYVPF